MSDYLSVVLAPLVVLFLYFLFAALLWVTRRADRGARELQRTVEIQSAPRRGPTAQVSPEVVRAGEALLEILRLTEDGAVFRSRLRIRDQAFREYVIRYWGESEGPWNDATNYGLRIYQTCGLILEDRLDGASRELAEKESIRRAFLPLVLDSQGDDGGFWHHPDAPATMYGAFHARDILGYCVGQLGAKYKGTPLSWEVLAGRDLLGPKRAKKFKDWFNGCQDTGGLFRVAPSIQRVGVVSSDEAVSIAGRTEGLLSSSVGFSQKSRDRLHNELLGETDGMMAFRFENTEGSEYSLSATRFGLDLARSAALTLAENKPDVSWILENGSRKRVLEFLRRCQIEGVGLAKDRPEDTEGGIVFARQAHRIEQCLVGPQQPPSGGSGDGPREDNKMVECLLRSIRDWLGASGVVGFGRHTAPNIFATWYLTRLLYELQVQGGCDSAQIAQIKELARRILRSLSVFRDPVSGGFLPYATAALR